MRFVRGGVIGAAIFLAACGSKPHTQVSAPTGNWISLFNGHDLTGWTPRIAGEDAGVNYHNTFRVENGLLKVSYQDYDRFADHFGSLYYNTPYSRYWLRVEYRFVGDAAPGAPAWAWRNSGIQLHSQPPTSLARNQQFPVSVEFDLVGSRMLGHPTGDVCHYGTRVSLQGKPLKELCSKVSDVVIRGDEWVTAVAQVDGSRLVRQIVNGALIVEYTDLALDDSNADAHRLLASGASKTLSSGLVSLQSNGAPVEFRRIELLPMDQDPAAASAHAGDTTGGTVTKP